MTEEGLYRTLVQRQLLNASASDSALMDKDSSNPANQSEVNVTMDASLAVDESLNATTSTKISTVDEEDESHA